MKNGTIIKVSGPLIVAENIPGAKLYDTVLVSKMKLLGEIIEIRGNKASIQVYEETSGIGIGEPVVSNYRPLSVALGPGILSRMLDGIGRDLESYAQSTGFYLVRGHQVDSLDHNKKWDFVSLMKKGDLVKTGDKLGYVMDGNFKHFILVPHTIEGVLVSIEDGSYTLDDPVATVKTQDGIEDVVMVQYWPIRKGRPYRAKKLPRDPLVTGQRIVDTFFPVAKGGTACVPGPFGSGKTVVQHQLAKWSDSDVVVYIGCGERGNEMTDVLNEFPEIVDPRTEQPLMNKTVLIANTSNMPVTAREASIYTGMSIAEYFRDMGYNVAMMADSTSRWAEALREMSGRLEEMPGDEGYPAYLGSRLAEVYERAGIVDVLGSNEEGSVTMIGAVSPAGGDLSEPVTQATLRIVKVFWALDSSLAYARHFPAINWLDSYSLYQKVSDAYLEGSVNRNYPKYRQEAMLLLQEEKRLQEIVQLIGRDALSDNEILKLEVARMLREDFLQQNAFQEEDTFTSLEKQALMLETIMVFYDNAQTYLVEENIFLADITNMDVLYEISRMKYVHEDNLDSIRGILDRAIAEFEILKLGDRYHA